MASPNRRFKNLLVVGELNVYFSRRKFYLGREYSTRWHCKFVKRQNVICHNQPNMSKPHPAAEYNRIRRILFSTIHKSASGFVTALEWLENYQKSLGPAGYTGLKAEINFYIKNQKNLSLSVGADVGDHTDFIGSMGSKIFRFDVTTNLKYKNLKDYEPLQKTQNARYKIVVANTDGEIDEILDINFPFCPLCQLGRLIDIVVLYPETKSDLYLPEYGTAYFQKHLLICSECEYYEEKKKIHSPFLPTFYEECYFNENQIISYNNSIEPDQEILDYDQYRIIKEHAVEHLPFLEMMFDQKIMALGDYYKLKNERIIEVKWKKNVSLIKNYIKQRNRL